MMLSAMCKEHHFFVSFVIVCKLVLSHCENDSCIYNPLNPDMNYYDKHIYFTRTYILPVPCEGYVAKIDIYVYDSGTVSLEFLEHRAGSWARLIYFTEEVNLVDGRTSLVTLQLHEPFYVSKSLMLKLYNVRSSLSVMRDRIMSTLNENDDVVGIPGQYIENQTIVEETSKLLYFQNERLPSLQMQVQPRASTVSRSTFTTETEKYTVVSTGLMTTSEMLTTHVSTGSSMTTMEIFYCVFCLFVILDSL